MAENGTEVYSDSAMGRRMNSKYDSLAEQELIGWISQLVGQSITPGRENVQAELKNGQIILKLINVIYERTSSLPPRAQSMQTPFKPNTSSMPFKQMENIQIFLNAAEAYGVPKTSLFQTVDLYEGRNMSQVLNTLLQLGTECQRNGFQGPVCGPRPTEKVARQWTREQLKAGDGIISLQAGTNKLASQKGMSIGSVRHCADTKVDEMSQSSAGICSLQMGTNKFASQKGMKFGGVRHIADIRCDDFSKEGQSIITLQMGTNQFASQKGMVMGGSRHGADIRCDDISKEGQSIINLQMGTNQLASQTGMRIGTQRHITDIHCDGMTAVGASTLGLQMGPSMNQVATQSGLSFGAHRHINDSY